MAKRRLRTPLVEYSRITQDSSSETPLGYLWNTFGRPGRSLGSLDGHWEEAWTVTGRKPGRSLRRSLAVLSRWCHGGVTVVQEQGVYPGWCTRSGVHLLPTLLYYPGPGYTAARTAPQDRLVYSYCSSRQAGITLWATRARTILPRKSREDYPAQSCLSSSRESHRGDQARKSGNGQQSDSGRSMWPLINLKRESRGGSQNPSSRVIHYARASRKTRNPRNLTLRTDPPADS